MGLQSARAVQELYFLNSSRAPQDGHYTPYGYRSSGGGGLSSDGHGTKVVTVLEKTCCKWRGLGAVTVKLIYVVIAQVLVGRDRCRVACRG